MSRLITKSSKVKHKGQYIRVRHIYRICGIPLYFRDEKISYSKNFMDTYCKARLYGDYPMMLDIGEFIVKSPDIVEKTQRLLSGMKGEQARKILKVISRLKQSYLSSNRNIEISDTSEVAALIRVKDFYDSIVEIAPDVFCYDGYFLPTKSFGENVFLNKQGLYNLESKTLEMIKHRDIVDVGGYVGDSAILFEREFTLKNVYTFEATKTNFNLMQKTLKLNDSKRIVPINKGLGSKNEILEMCVDGGTSSLNEKMKNMFEYSRTESVEIIPLDSYVAEHNIDVGLIKVDIEGFEQEFLKGAKETIKKFKPAMLISVYHNASDFFDIKPLIESWDLGYTFKFDKPVDGCISIESVLLCEVV